MSTITLIEGRHRVVLNGDIPMLDSDGKLIIQDVQDNKIISLPKSEEMLKFFNLHYADESSVNNNLQYATELPINNNLQYAKELSINYNDGANTSGMAVLSESASETPTTATACWKDDNEVRCLIYLWRDHQDNFKSMKSRDIWLRISKELQETNSKWKKKTQIQCENKWKDVKRKYMETKDHNSKSGNNPKTCKFYEELEEVLGEKPCVKPIAIASTLNKRKIVSIDQHDSDELSEDYDSATQDADGRPPKTTKKRKVSRIQRELQDWSAALLADAKAREDARERRHTENITGSKAMVDAYKDMMAKLIEKLCVFCIFDIIQFNVEN